MNAGHTRSVVAQAPGKINLGLWVGPPDDSGYHPVLTAFQAVDLWEVVTLTEAHSLTLSVTGGVDCSGVPLGPHNIAWMALEKFARARDDTEVPAVSISIDKSVPVAGGMAGGSADAAATLLALQQWWQPPMADWQIAALAAELGSDVPFSLQGGSAIGRGRGVLLTAVYPKAPLHLVVVPAAFELSTAAVYRQSDGQGPRPPLAADLPDGFLDAWLAGDAARLAPLLHNDLEAPARDLRPELSTTLDDVHSAGALRAMVSGSGPTVLGFAKDADHARAIARTLGTQGYLPIVTHTVVTPGNH
ncbi:MAG: 4-(cytidine 5'-diphospho)-2-C-methyl-D-erythritol kinase [Pontimonas sp.]